jgi:hypothetical protein
MRRSHKARSAKSALQQLELLFGLIERAIAAARQIQFEPAELDGKKVAYPLMVVYNFLRPR